MKEFKTIDEQLDLLIKRNLNVPDKDLAKKHLANLNYYRLSGYSLTLRKNNRFCSGTKFEDIIDIYEGDREVRALLLKYLAEIEISLRTHIGYIVGEIDAAGLTSQTTFNTTESYVSFMEKMKSSVSDNKSGCPGFEPPIVHHSKHCNFNGCGVFYFL